MLENIKSSFNLKNIFSFISDDKKKLKLIKYNKNLQQKVDINLINYQLFSGKYIVYEKNGKCKIYKANEYIEDMLIFEGEYNKYGKNGKGKEYYSNINVRGCKFEGEYLNGVRHGKGKEYDIYCRLIFEGEYIDGKRWRGKLKKFSDDCSYKHIIKFEGEYSNGEINGKGKEYYSEGELKFEGEYLNGKKWNGIFYNKYSNKRFILKNGQGFIKEYYENGRLKFEGEYFNGERYGKGKEYDYDGKLTFDGDYLNGKRWNGKIYENNMIFPLTEGNGYIKIFDHHGELEFEGEYSNGEINGKGKEYDKYNNLIFEGEYLKGKKWNGKFKKYCPWGHYLNFEGEYLNGLRHGKGKEYYENGNLSFEAEYLNGVRHGKVKQYEYNGELRFDGEYLNDYRFKGKEFKNGKLIYEVNIYIVKNGMERDMMKMVILYMN